MQGTRFALNAIYGPQHRVGDIVRNWSKKKGKAQDQMGTMMRRLIEKGLADRIGGFNFTRSAGGGSITGSLPGMIISRDAASNRAGHTVRSLKPTVAFYGLAVHNAVHCTIIMVENVGTMRQTLWWIDDVRMADVSAPSDFLRWVRWSWARVYDQRLAKGEISATQPTQIYRLKPASTAQRHLLRR